MHDRLVRRAEIVVWGVEMTDLELAAWEAGGPGIAAPADSSGMDWITAFWFMLRRGGCAMDYTSGIEEWPDRHPDRCVAYEASGRGA